MRQTLAQIEWITLGLILGCYGLWALALLAWSTAFWPVGLIALPILAAFHSSLQHETIHGHPTDSATLNEALASLPLSVIFPYRRYKTLHLHHHRDEHLTDPFEDPESYFWSKDAVHHMTDFQRSIFALNNTFVGRLVIGPALTIIGFTRTEIARIRADDAGVRTAWALHAVGLALLFFIITQIYHMSALTYLVFAVYPSLSIIAMRSYAEHQAAENVGARTSIVETIPALGLLYLNNNLHIVHHASPTTPWYDLPTLYQKRRDLYLSANENTLFNGYWDIARRFAWTAKQPIQHPFDETGSRVDPLP